MYKQIFLSLLAIATITLSSFGQAPESFNYQAVVRNAGNTILNNQAVGLRMTIQQGSIGGTTVYSETFSPTTNAYGLVNLQIGNGTVVSGTFANIDWSAGPYFMETAVDVTGGTNYSVMGTSQLMSVPYALYAKTSGNGQGPAGPQGIQGPAGVDGINGTNVGVGGFTHYLGESYNGGIIYYLYKGGDGLEHGLIVALTESTGAWQTTATLVNANRTEDGAYNTTLMTDSPVASYIATLGAGWYLPSIDELGLLYYNRYSTQKGLRTGGNTLLSNTAFYWSSNEYQLVNLAWFFSFFDGFASFSNKTDTNFVRGVRAF
jgi:hypothetical protein